AGPEHAHLRVDLLVRDPRVVGDAALAGDAQLLEDLARTAERHAVRPVESESDVLDDAPVLACLAGARNGLVDLDDAALDLRDGPLVFFLQAAGKHDVGVSRGLA